MLSFILVSTRDAYVFVRSALDLDVISKMKVYMAHQMPVVLIVFGMAHFGTECHRPFIRSAKLNVLAQKEAIFHALLMRIYLAPKYL